MKIARLVHDCLEHAGFQVIVTGDGGAALASARGAKPDLVVLDLGLPGLDGLDVTRELRRSSNIPIVILTARGDEADRIVGLELGADDYVVKPFSPEELRGWDIEIEVPRLRVWVGVWLVDLTPTEFQLLAPLVPEQGQVSTRDQP